LPASIAHPRTREHTHMPCAVAFEAVA
jgi:hypothetical protein